MTTHNRVMIESGEKKVFASAIDWPGWSRSGKTEEEAIQALKDYADRYEKVARRAGVRGVKSTAADLDVIQRAKGTATTDFGAPDVPAKPESDQLSDAECERMLKLVEACWDEFDAVGTRVSATMQKGPRGGGRDRDKIIAHTLEAERNYARNVGVKTPPDGLDTAKDIAAHREAVVEAIRQHNADRESAKKWPLWYFVRRLSWHVLDHAWEMEDKDLTGKESRDAGDR